MTSSIKEGDILSFIVWGTQVDLDAVRETWAAQPLRFSLGMHQTRSDWMLFSIRRLNRGGQPHTEAHRTEAQNIPNTEYVEDSRAEYIGPRS